MSPEDPKPLPASTVDLLRAEKGAIFAPADARTRVLSRLASTLPLTGRPGEDGGGGGAAPAPSPRPDHLRHLVRPLSLGLAFATGALGGAAAWNALRPSPERVIVYVDRPMPVAAPALAPAAAPSSTAPAEPAKDPARPAVDSPARSLPDALAAERALLDVARTAIARGDGEDALLATARHQKRFPAGALAEEREAMAIQALILLRRDDEARFRGAEFHKHFPGSVLGPAVDAALGTIR